MDIWYLFGDLGLTLLKPNAHLGFIATNNWVTNSGASKFRNILLEQCEIINLTDFGSYMVFDNASIQTMVMLFRKNSEVDNYFFDYRCLYGNNRTKADALSLLNKSTIENSLLYYPPINRVTLKNKLLTFTTEDNYFLLQKIKAKQNFHLREKSDKEVNLKAEIGQGIVAPQDFANSFTTKKLNEKGVKLGDGIFVLSNSEFESKNFSEKETQIIKPYYTSSQLKKYYGNYRNSHWIIYTKSNIIPLL